MNIVVYHSADFDGRGSAAIIKNTSSEFSGAKYVGLDHSEESKIKSLLDEVLNKNVLGDTGKLIVVDFSFKVEYLRKLYELLGDRFILIDHHISIIREIERAGLTSKIAGLRRDGTAASVLTWEYFNAPRDLPRALKYIGDYDVFNLTDPNTEIFQHGLNTYDTGINSHTWKVIIKSDKKFIDEVLTKGKTVHSYLNSYLYPSVVKHCVFKKIFGFNAVVCNNPIKTSKVFEVIDPEKYRNVDLIMTYVKTSTGDYSVSIYRTPHAPADLDCSVIAKSLGGGGHRGAAGFKANQKQIDEFTK